jgi:hypothetical protein
MRPQLAQSNEPVPSGSSSVALLQVLSCLVVRHIPFVCFQTADRHWAQPPVTHSIFNDIPTSMQPNLNHLQNMFYNLTKLTQERQESRFACVRPVATRLFGFLLSESQPSSERFVLCLSKTEGSTTSLSALGTNIIAPNTHRRRFQMSRIRRLIHTFDPVRYNAGSCVDQRNITDHVDVSHLSRDEDVYSDGDDSDVEDENDRRHFKVIRKISPTSLEELVLKLTCPEDVIVPSIYRITHHKEGSFHHYVFFQLDIGDKLEKTYVLKILAHGTAAHWVIGDTFMLRNEAVMMQNIHHHTKCPVSEVVAFNDTLEDSISAPYILMKKTENISPLALWRGKMLANQPAGGAEYMGAD